MKLRSAWIITAVAGIALLQSSSALARDPVGPTCIMTNLRAVAMRWDFKRSGSTKKFWDKYKSDPLFAAWIEEKSSGIFVAARFKDDRRILEWIDEYDHLSAKAKARIRPANEVVDLGAACNENLCGPRYVQELLDRPDVIRQLTVYDSQVLRLRPGDTVVFGEDRFVLGEFLGSGNATQVWEIVGDPDHVLRIPFLAGPLREQNRALLAAEGKELTLEHVRSYIGRLRTSPDLEEGIPHVKVAQVGANNMFARVGRIHGKETGDAFASRYRYLIYDFQSHVSQGGTLATYDLKKGADLAKLSEAETLDILKRHKRLEYAVSRLRGSDPGRRQFIWDTQLGDWVLADW